jgi:hypothetical protein
MVLVFFLISIAMAKPTVGRPHSHPDENHHYSHPLAHNLPVKIPKKHVAISSAKKSAPQQFTGSDIKHAIPAPQLDVSRHAETETKYALGLDTKYGIPAPALNIDLL